MHPSAFMILIDEICAHLCNPLLSRLPEVESRKAQLRGSNPLQGHSQLRVCTLRLKVTVHHQQHPEVAAAACCPHWTALWKIKRWHKCFFGFVFHVYWCTNILFFSILAWIVKQMKTLHVITQPVQPHEIEIFWPGFTWDSVRVECKSLNKDELCVETLLELQALFNYWWPSLIQSGESPLFKHIWENNHRPSTYCMSSHSTALGSLRDVKADEGRE